MREVRLKKRRTSHFSILLCSIMYVFLLSPAGAQEIEWMSMNEALKAQEKESRKIFMDAYTSWCGPCKLLDRNTFSNADVIAFINKNYYPVKFNAEGTDTIYYRDMTFTNPNHDPARTGRNSQHDFARAMRIMSYPSLVFFDEDGALIGPVAGYRTPHQLEVLLKLFQKEAYQKINSAQDFQEYSSGFVHEFRVSK